MGGIQIVPFRRRQLTRILEIEKASFAAEAWPREYFLEFYADCGKLFLAAKLSGRIAGYMVTCVDNGVAEVASLAVDPAYRRRGVAQALLRHTLRRLKRADVGRAVLMVRTENAAGAALYRSFGFRRVRRVRGYYEDGGDGWRMVHDQICCSARWKLPPRISPI